LCQTEEIAVGVKLNAEEDVNQDIPNKEEKQRNELYANILASSLFLDEEEEAKRSLSSAICLRVKLDRIKRFKISASKPKIKKTKTF
jgi:hypothetical protein